MTKNDFRPLGSRDTAQFPLSRRAFLGASVAVPAALAFDGKAWATGSPEDSNGVRFLEDEHGMSIVTSQDKAWHLRRLAFGPSTIFTLRTLQAGSSKGYELEVGGVRFGTLHQRSHWIVFQRANDDWLVRMRSNLWSDVNDEIVSDDILLSELVKPGIDPQSPSWFVFKRTTNVSNQILESELEGHVRPSGRMQLELDADCAWRFKPRDSSYLAVAPYGFHLVDLTLAWCEPVSSPSKNQLAGIPDHLTALGMLDEDTELSLLQERDKTGGSNNNLLGDQPCCQDNKSKKKKAPARSPEPGGALIAEPVFCASGLTHPGANKILYRGESSFTASLAHSNGKEPKPTATLSYTYLRRSWNSENRPGAGNPAGIAEIRSTLGQWSFTTSVGRQQSFGPVVVEDASIRVRRRNEGRADGFEDEFSGFASLGPTTSAGVALGSIAISPIGELQAGSWSHEDRTVAGNRTILQARFSGKASSGEPGNLQRLSVPFLLYECNLSLVDADFSRFTFSGTAVIAFWCPLIKAQEILPQAQSYIWLGSTQLLRERPAVKLDLTRARVAVGRSLDLMDAAFLFADLYLEVRPGMLRIVPSASSYRVLERTVPVPHNNSSQALYQKSIDGGANILDTRPVLIAEFPPQHLFEESLFRPGGGDFPEVPLVDSSGNPIKQFTFTFMNGDPQPIPTNPAELIRYLESLPNVIDRSAVRAAFASMKIDQEKKGPFRALYNELSEPEYKKGFCQEVADQFVYIGPYGMDPDVRAQARTAMNKLEKTPLEKYCKTLLELAANIAMGLDNRDIYKDDDPSFTAGLVRSGRAFWRKIFGGSPIAATTAAEAILHEQVICSVLPDYAFFRDFYREQMTRQWMLSGDNERERTLSPTNGTPEQIEFFAENNRAWGSSDLKKQMEQRQDRVREEYAQVLVGTAEIPTIMRARLANPSRLAFRLNLKQDETLNFSLESLLNWQQHDLAVTPRARAVTNFDQAGRPPLRAEQTPPNQPEYTLEEEIPELSGKQEDSHQTKEQEEQLGAMEDIAMLGRLGFRFGQFVTAQERLSDVEASLRRPPDQLETAIEIPARLILSPSQRAQWRIPWTPILKGPFPALSNRKSKTPTTRLLPLWSVELITQGVDPSLRAVYSPDLRPGFVRRNLERAAAEATNAKRTSPLFTVAAAAPPRGPRAPWTLGMEDGDPSASELEDLAPQLGVSDKEVLKRLLKIERADACRSAESPSIDPTLHPLISYLRWRRFANQEYGESAIFRSSLDAYDRHEIVILSSAYGLSVRGKRDVSGKLLPPATSSQVEPPPLLQPIDLELGSALYRPRSLKVQELRLSALGGTFRHDTDFVPPTAAHHVLYGALHDSLSVERWQHWVVLGRDVFAEVVYKGFLFPIGHRASLVKQTERVFMKATSNGSVRAYLRQRLFIRVGQPDKTFPALGQPNLGRQFPAQLVKVLTTVTPDLVDPSQDSGQQPNNVSSGLPLCQLGATPAGRLLTKMPGLVFWPRTARVPGTEVRFQALLDGAFVKLPLIFVDNTATQDSSVLAALVIYYNNLCSPDQTIEPLEPVRPDQHIRTIGFAGQTLRYCDELKPGSASHRTLFWTLKASGGVKRRPQPDEASVSGWEGDNTSFDNPILEGADQPPFYPAVETARIRLDQIERMTTQKTVVGLAKFDNHYVAYGFPPATGPDKEPQEEQVKNQAPQGVRAESGKGMLSLPTGAQANQLEIYLGIVNDVSFSMGASGDRSGGVYRPGGSVVALSRSRGPISGSGDVRQKPTVVADYQGNGKSTYAAYFNSNTPGQAQQDPLDTKLLGIVSLKDLIKEFQHFRPANQGLPQLKEVLNYGAAAESSTEDTLRNDVIRPLTAVFAELETQWNRLDREVQESKGPIISIEIRMADIFPELDRAKNDFSAALGRVAALNGVEFYASLADIYETGRRLADALQQTSLHSVERAFLAVTNAIPNFLKSQSFDIDQLKKAVSDRLKYVVGDLSTFSEALASLILNDRRSAARFFPVLGGMDENTLTALLNNLNLLVDALGTASRTEPEECAKQFVETLIEKAPDIKPLSESWRQTTVPLISLANKLSHAFQSSDLRGWAATALEMINELWALPENWRLNDSDLQKRLRSLLDDLTGLGDDIASLKTDTLKEDFIPQKDTIVVPADWKQPSKGWTTTTVERTLYDFAIAAQAASKPIRSGDSKSYLVSAGNAALVATQELHRLCDQLRSQQYLQDLDHVTEKDAVLRLAPELLERLFSQFDSLMKMVVQPLAAILSKTLPVLNELEEKSRKQVADKLHDILSQIVKTQRQALDLSDHWISQWTKLDSLDDKAAATALAKTVQTSMESLDKARSAVNKCSEWTDWLVSDRSVLQPLPTDFLSSMSIQGSQHLIQWWSQTLSSQAEAAQKAASIAIPLIRLLADQYQNFFDVRSRIISKTSTLPAQLIPSFYIRPESNRVYGRPNFSPNDRLDEDHDQLHWDLESLKTVSRKDPKGLLDEADSFRFLMNFLNGWVEGSDTPTRIIQQIQGSLSLESARARLLSIIDFSKLREEIDAAIKNLIPHSSELTYSFALALERDGALEASQGFFEPQDGCALTVTSKTKIDFLNKTAQFRSEGELGPFHIKLLGRVADALTLKFDGVRFESTGGPVHCDVKFQSFKIGEMLKFLEQLQKFLSPEKGSGFYLVPLSTGLGIEAGYGLKLGTISFGNVSFSNVSLNAAARLPFDGREATFVSSLSRRDAPFTISVAPYGGSGFFLIEASAKGVTAFEASFEYGGAAAFQYGPLSGKGRVMVGVYIRVGNKGSIAATFYAGGTASIWIFTFGASLYVTAASEEGKSTITGTATFTFSFSIGFADYDFSVTVSKSLTWGGGSGSSSNNQTGSLHFDAAPFSEAANSQVALFRADSWCQSEHWGRHRDHFDTTLPIEVLEFA